MPTETPTRVIVCAKCGQRLRVPASSTPKMYRCVKCGASVEDTGTQAATAPAKPEVAAVTSDSSTLTDPFASLLRETNLVTSEQIEEAQAQKAEKGGKLFDILIRLGHLPKDKLHGLLSKQGGVASISLSHFTVDRELTNILPRDIVVQHFALPIDKLGKLLTVAMVCPVDMEAITAIQEATQLRVKPMLCTYDDFIEVVQKNYRLPEVTEPEKPAPGKSAAPAPKTAESTVQQQAQQQAQQAIVEAIVEALMERVDTVDRLEIHPEMSTQTTALLGGGPEALRHLVGVVGASPPFAATVLWTANSSAYGLTECVDNLPMAVILLGDQGVNFLASNARPLIPSMERQVNVITQHSQCVSEAAALLASVTKRAIPNVAQCAGLLYSLGSYVLASLRGDEYLKMDPQLFGKARAQAEKQIFGVGHDEVGGRLLERWHVAQTVCMAVRHYRNPAEAGEHRDLANIVRVAVAAITPDGAFNEAALNDVADSMQELGLDASAVGSALSLQV